MQTPKALSPEQVQMIGGIRPTQYVSEGRLRELMELASQGYPASAICQAIRDAVYAAKFGVLIPPAIDEQHR